MTTMGTETALPGLQRASVWQVHQANWQTLWLMRWAALPAMIVGFLATASAETREFMMVLSLGYMVPLFGCIAAFLINIALRQRIGKSILLAGVSRKTIVNSEILSLISVPIVSSVIAGVWALSAPTGLLFGLVVGFLAPSITVACLLSARAESTPRMLLIGGVAVGVLVAIAFGLSSLPASVATLIAGVLQVIIVHFGLRRFRDWYLHSDI